jgi:hypothetical protein
MKYLSTILLLTALILMGCPNPSDPVPMSKAFVVNSAWQVVLTADIETGSKGLTESDLQGQVDAYNSATTDDQHFLYMDEIPPIEEAPTCDIYIVVASTHLVVYQDLGIDRAARGRIGAGA